MVEIFSTPSCQGCRLSKRRMDERGVKYIETDLSRDEAAMSRVKALGYNSAPVIIAGDKHWSGFDPNKLDALKAA